jgi:hypothetical protein
MTNRQVPGNCAISSSAWPKINGYRYINILVEFNQAVANEPPVNLGVMFAFNANGTMHARRYANLEHNLGYPQSTHYIEVSGQQPWDGSSSSTYLARFPVMGPFIEVIVDNQASVTRTVSVWGYLVS